MSLAAGTRLGVYEILGQIGAGGMGEVYKARDTLLQRLAAVKILPRDKVADPDRRARFIREAQAASALNHPNIVTIYSIDHDVKSDLDFIAMEYVPGRTLGEAIGRRGLKLKEMLGIGIQIADALAAAHASGIVHRDLKPANVMVNANGSAKVLDFGLAKLVEPAELPADQDTRTIRADRPTTETGTIVGTVSYMSPEQAEGKAVDSRSDIFSYGSLLYEMASGRRAFQGDSRMSILSAILRDDPKALSQVAGETLPRDLEKIIARCLRKDVSRRFQHIDDVKIALEELKEESDSGQLAVPAVAGERRGHLARWAIVLAALIGIAAAAAVYYRGRHAERVEKSRMVRLTFDAGLSFYPTLSPDSSLLAYASDRSGEGNLDIWVRQMAGGEAIRLTHDPASHSEPAFSPDGSKIVFRWEREGGGLYVIPALGAGDARKIADGGHNPRFSPDGKWVSYWMNAGLRNTAEAAFLVPAAGGPPRRIAPEFVHAATPIWAGDATHILFVGSPAVGGVGPSLTNDWYVTTVNADPPVRTRIMEALQRIGASGSFQSAVGAVSTPMVTGEAGDLFRMILSVRIGDTANLWKIPLAPRTWQAAGEPDRLTFGAGSEAFPAAMADGRVVFASIDNARELWGASLATGEHPQANQLTRLTANAGMNSFPTLARDGKKLGFICNRSGKSEIWVKDLEAGKEHSLTSDGVRKLRALMSPDGSSLTYGTPNGIETVAVSGGQPETLCAKCGPPWGWNPDGTLLLHFIDYTAIGLFNTRDRSSIEVLKSPKYGLAAARFSPDGRWLSFHASTSATTRRIYVAPFRGASAIPETDWIPITGDKALDREPRWSPDGNSLYFLSTRDGNNCIWSQRLDSGKRSIGEPSAVLHLHAARSNLNVADTGPIGLSIAAGRLVFAMPEATGNIWMLQ